MDFAQAKELLSGCLREGLDDYAFGDSERGWWLDGEHIAEGYFGGGNASVTLLKENITFKGDEARQLKYCGSSPRGSVRRNDSVGEYADPRRWLD